jgi:redox-sensitive bicupin YhaK (pirin superfamily)
MNIRPANTRGILVTNWIHSRRTFSNNSYWDPRYQGWGNLKVINDDVQQPGNQVPNHPHRNFDILGYMVEGELEHTDSLGNTSRAVPGQVQHMWCGREIWHTEASVGTTPARYLQLWIAPKDQYRDTEPYYEIIEKSPEFGPIAVVLKQDMTVSAGILSESISAQRAYLYVVTGTCSVNGTMLSEGDGAELANETIIPVNAPHIILFEPVD